MYYEEKLEREAQRKKKTNPAPGRIRTHDLQIGAPALELLLYNHCPLFLFQPNILIVKKV